MGRRLFSDPTPNAAERFMLVIVIMLEFIHRKRLMMQRDCEIDISMIS
jgi:hypothetical protein